MNKLVRVMFVRGAAIGAGTLVFLLLPIILNIEDYGKVVFFWVAANVFSGISSFGYGNYLLKIGVGCNKEDPIRILKADFIKYVIGFPMLVLALIFLICSVVTTGTDNFESEQILKILLMSYCLNLIKIKSIFLRVRNFELAAVWWGEVQAQVFLFLIVMLGFFYLEEPKIWDVLEYFLLLMILVSAISCFYVIKSVNDKKSTDKSLPNYNFNFAYNSALQSVSTGLDIFAVRIMGGDAYVGIYQLAKKLGSLVALPQQITNWIVAIEPVKLFKSGKLEEANQKIEKTLRFTFNLSLIVVCLSIASIMYFVYSRGINQGEFVIIALIFIANSLVVVGTGANFILASQLGYERMVVKLRLVLLLFPIVAYGVIGMLEMFGVLQYAGVYVALSYVLVSTYVQVKLSRDVYRITKIKSSIFIPGKVVV